MTPYACYGGQDCHNQARRQNMGISQYCICEMQDRVADKQIAARVREIAKQPGVERVSIMSLKRIVITAEKRSRQ